MQTFTVQGQYVVEFEYEIEATDKDAAQFIVEEDLGITVSLDVNNIDVETVVKVKKSDFTPIEFEMFRII